MCKTTDTNQQGNRIMRELYDECVSRGIPTQSHESDLYIPATEETRQLLKERDLRALPFTNQVEGGTWFDVPFQFLPYWRSKQKQPAVTA